MSFDSLVSLHDFFCVDGEPFVWVHHHTKEPRVCLDRKETHCKTKAETDSVNMKSTKLMYQTTVMF